MNSGNARALPDWLRPLAVAVAGVSPDHPNVELRPPSDGTGRESAVLITLTQTADGPGVLLIERASGMRHHAGQTAFPGGAVDAADADAVATALREATEEIGLDPASVQVFAQLPRRFLPPSGFIVTPVLCWWARPHLVTAVDPGEVARVVEVRLAQLSDPANRFCIKHPRRGTSPAFQVGDLFVWGFTAGLLDELLSLGGWERPWNRADVRPLPAGVLANLVFSEPAVDEALAEDIAP